MLIRKKITTLISVFGSVIFLLPSLVSAQVAQDFGTDVLSGVVTATTRDLFDIVTGIVNTALYFLGAIAILLFLYAGWLWFTSQGNKDKIEKAKKIMVSAIIGLAIIFSSYAVVNWIFKDAIERAFYGVTGSGDPSYGGGVGIGGGVIESHYPESNAKSVPRNTNIYVTFKEPMKLDTIASSSGCETLDPTKPSIKTCPIKTNNIRLYNDTLAETTWLNNMTVTYDTGDLTVFEFNPYGLATTGTYLLGEQTRDIKYKMSLVNLTTATNRPAFNFGSYSWYFTVGTYSDITAPRVVSVRPKLNAESPRNTIVQINFSEAVNPTLATGVFDKSDPDYENIYLNYDVTATSTGRYVISNQYRTVEFIPSTLCGLNSCGLNIYCLDGPENFVGVVTTAIKDMVGNPLAARYSWNFETLNNIDLKPPKMISMEPTDDSASISEPVRMTFDKSLLSKSVNSSNIKLFKETNIPTNYWLSLTDSSTMENNVINIRHERFSVSTSYLATTTSGIMDENQNCWYPCRCEGASCDCDDVDSSGSTVCKTVDGVYRCQTE